MPLLSIISDNPLLRAMQLFLLLAAVISVFLVLFTTRDVILRTQTFWVQLLSILVVAALPIVGFLLYLLLRPSRTLKEKELEGVLYTLLERTSPPAPRKESRRDTKGEKRAEDE